VRAAVAPIDQSGLGRQRKFRPRARDETACEGSRRRIAQVAIAVESRAIVVSRDVVLRGFALLRAAVVLCAVAVSGVDPMRVG
jgi:hypothetical protein